MNEQELRDGLREMMVASSPPPAMNPATALDSARRAHKRRRATWAGVGVGAAVVTLAVGTVVAVNRTTDAVGPAQQLPIASSKPSELPLPPGSHPTTTSGGVPTTSKSWPNGQQDRTATNGPRATNADKLLNALKGALPDTLTVNTKITYPGSQTLVTGTQASFEDYVGPDKKEVWQYLATAAVNRKADPNGTGRIMVGVYTPGNIFSADICTAVPKFWGAGGSCEVRTVQGKQVGVVLKPQDPRLGQVAGLRYQDGTIVFVAQSKDPDNEGAIGRGTSNPGLAELPLTAEQLAQLALNPGFKVD